MSHSNDPNPGPPDNNRPQAPSPPSFVVLFGWVFLAMMVIAFAGAGWFYQLRKKQVQPPPPIISRITTPTFTDENGTSFPLSQLKGRVWVVNFIFTRCGGQCPIMTANMRELQTWLTENNFGNVQLVSITVDPENDKPDILKKYATTFKAIPGKWHFLTGDRKTIYDFILNEFKLATDEEKNQPIAEMFVHSDKFVLIDTEFNIRGYYSGSEGKNTDTGAMENLKQAIISISQQPVTK